MGRPESGQGGDSKDRDKEGWSSLGQPLSERTVHRSVLQPLDGHQACVLWKQTLNLLGPAV